MMKKKLVTCACAIIGLLVVGVSVTLGLLVSDSTGRRDPSPFSAISSIIGWLYFFAWSLSFWPQVFLNCARKSVEGLSVDFVLYNMLGFTCYSVYNALLLWSPSIVAQYEQRHGDKKPTVRVNDFVFSAHAWVVTLLTLLQIILYPQKRERISVVTYSLLAIAFAAIGLFLLLVIIVSYCNYKPLSWLSWLNFLEFISYIKIAVTLIKYLPQLLLNCRRRSTDGWSINNIWLDISGGCLSLTQQLIDSASTGNWSGISGDLTKTCLGALSITFDLLFLSQHYICLNRKKRLIGKENEGSVTSKKTIENYRRLTRETVASIEEETKASHTACLPNLERDSLSLAVADDDMIVNYTELANNV